MFQRLELDRYWTGVSGVFEIKPGFIWPLKTCFQHGTRLEKEHFNMGDKATGGPRHGLHLDSIQFTKSNRILETLHDVYPPVPFRLASSNSSGFY